MDPDIVHHDEIWTESDLEKARRRPGESATGEVKGREVRVIPGSPGRVAALVFVLLSTLAMNGGGSTNLGELNILVIGVFLEGENRVISDGQLLIETEDFEAVTAATISDLDEYVGRVSYQQASVSGQFTGPYDIGTGICAIGNLSQRLQEVYRRALDHAQLDVDPSLFNRVAFVHPSISGCLATPSSAIATYEYDGSTLTFHGIHATSFDRVTWIHEFGHSFGNVVDTPIGHVELLDCQDGAGNFQIISDDCAGKYNFFNSMYDPMGVLTASHFSSINKEKIGWLLESDFRVAVEGEFSLDSLESGRGGILALKVPLPGHPYQLRVEYRVPEPAPPTSIRLSIRSPESSFTQRGSTGATTTFEPKSRSSSKPASCI